MSSINKRGVGSPQPITHNGGPASRITKEQELRRTVLTSMLWESSYYEDGQSVADRIKKLVASLDDSIVQNVAIEAREKQHLRHVPLLLVREMTRNKSKLVAETLERVIQRADELTEFLSIYWKDKREPLSNQAKKGLARAFSKFSAYDLAKYNRDNAIKLRDVLFLSHAKPKNAEQADLWKKLVDGTLESADTWEVRLSAGKGEGKKEAWETLIKEGKLGGLAFLRNLRNMQQEGVPMQYIREGLVKAKTDRVLPFRFISAAKYAPGLEPELEQLMFKNLSEMDKLKGKTVLLLDHSGSMIGAPVSAKSEIDRFDAGVALAMLLREICEDVAIYTFSESAYKIKQPRRGFALRDLLVNSPGGGTNVGASIRQALSAEKDATRLICITDEQSTDRVTNSLGLRGYMINVANYQNGVGYKGDFVHIDGWSEAIVDYIREYEKGVK